ncbi:lamin B receptor [Dermatophagoides farinae]|nr:7-dehydrocholesterol reductase-like [Dermatophagoides farinae]
MKTMLSLIQNIYHRLIRETIIPLLLLIISPNVAILLPYIVIYRKAELIETFKKHSVWNLTKHVWSSVDFFDGECWSIVIIALIWALLSLLILPGKKYYGPPTINNYRPQYWQTGFKFYLISMTITIPLIWHYSVLHLYYKIPNLIAILVVFGFVFCVFLYLKGLIAPDPGLYDMTGNPIFDFYWGIELYPQLGEYISLKAMINSRFGLWIWQLIVLICWKAHYELYNSQYGKGNIIFPMTTTTLLTTIYLAKFYYWEDGYMQTIDICVDRFGFYIAWGCIAAVPGFFTLPSLYLVKHSPNMNFIAIINLFIFILGLFSIFANYYTDYQRQLVRQTDGDCLIWSKKPVLIRAKYKDSNNVERNSVLLASGSWGMARHLNYLFELLIAFAFGAPALATSIIPYLYFLFIFILIIHRTMRDDDKCSKKYGRYWQEYCQLVPYKIVPYIF